MFTCYLQIMWNLLYDVRPPPSVRVLTKYVMLRVVNYFDSWAGAELVFAWPNNPHLLRML